MQAPCEALSLDNIPLFSDLLPKQLDQIAAHIKRKTLPAGTNVINSVFASDVVYIIEHGTVKVHIEQLDGSDVALDILGSGEFVGNTGLIDSYSCTISAMTMETTRLLYLPTVLFQQCLSTMPQFSFNLLRVLSQRLRQAEEHIHAFAKLDVNGRVARRILSFAEKYGQVNHCGDIFIPLRLTQSDFAALIGASRVRVNQALVTYKRHRYISIDHAYHVTVHNMNALARCCHQLNPQATCETYA